MSAPQLPGRSAEAGAAPQSASQTDETSFGDEAAVDEAWDFLAPPQAGDEIGRLGGYRILQVLGRGGMGVVFQAEDRQPQARRRPQGDAAVAGCQSVGQEALSARGPDRGRIKHDHIVTIHQVGEDRGAPFLAMEFLHGEPLDVRLKREGKLPILEVLRIGREVAEGLAAAHETGLIHRDIKPANVWLESRKLGGGVSTSPRVKILDFGLARAMDDQQNLTQTGAIIGTPSYMAPEQSQGGKVDRRCDLFSLGCMLYVMTTGEMPFKGTDTMSILLAVATSEAPPPITLNPETPTELSDLIQRLLAKNPNDRLQDASEVAATLRTIETVTAADDQTAALRRLDVPRTRQPAPAGRKPRRGVLVACGLAFLVAAVVAGIVFFLPSGNGVIRIEINDDSTQVTLTKTGAIIKRAGKEHEIKIAPGEHAMLVKRGDMELQTDKFVLKKGETVTLKVEFIKDKLVVLRADGTVLAQKSAPRGAHASRCRRRFPV